MDSTSSDGLVIEIDDVGQALGIRRDAAPKRLLEQLSNLGTNLTSTVRIHDGPQTPLVRTDDQALTLPGG